MSAPFKIYFMLDGKDYAFRAWPGVPRIGEEVMMHLKDGPVTYFVEAVIWGVREEEEVRDALTCNVSLRRVVKP